MKTKHRFSLTQRRADWEHYPVEYLLSCDSAKNLTEAITYFNECYPSMELNNKGISVSGNVHYEVIKLW
jgi:hypothetical protein